MAGPAAGRDEAKHVLLLSDFNIDPLQRFLEAGSGEPLLTVACAPYGQVRQCLLDRKGECWRMKPDACVVWTQLASVSPEFRRMLDGAEASEEELRRDVQNFAGQILAAADAARLFLIPVWTLPPWQRGAGFRDFEKDSGCRRALLEANLLLCEELDRDARTFALDTQRWTQLAGHRAYDARMQFIAKTPFGNDVFRAAAEDIQCALAGVLGMSRKVVVLDLDDTLWGGVVGDLGWQHLTLGGHDPLGESYVALQKTLKALTRRGILLAIASKNQEAIALEAIDRHPEMVLRREDFAGWRINWNDKAESLIDLLGELNLGLDSVVFLDDNPVERARVRDALPEVLTVELPQSPLAYAETVSALTCFDAPALTQEDRRRTAGYVAARERGSLRKQLPDRDAWLSSLETRCIVAPLSEPDLPRAAQLLNKTNQMNLATRRMTEQEFWAWGTHEEHAVFTFRVQDRFGDAGLTGILSLAKAGKTAVITDFVLSCRVMGRQIEEAMLATAVEAARDWELLELRATYSASGRNTPCHEMLLRSGLEFGGDRQGFLWPLDKPYPFPDSVAVEWPSEEA